MATYVPRQGDFISVTLDPQSGHEQRGRRPAFVVSKDLFNRRTGLAIVCPVTNTKRDFPFHVPVPEGSYPHLNDSARIKLMIRTVKTLGWLVPIALALSLAALLL